MPRGNVSGGREATDKRELYKTGRERERERERAGCRRGLFVRCPWGTREVRERDRRRKRAEGERTAFWLAPSNDQDRPRWKFAPLICQILFHGSESPGCAWLHGLVEMGRDTDTSTPSNTALMPFTPVNTYVPCVYFLALEDVITSPQPHIHMYIHT